jgi:hypothetical protein
MTRAAISAWCAEHESLAHASRQDFYRLLDRLGLDNGAEIGVEGGSNAALMLATCPRLRLLGVDAWQAYAEYRDYKRQRRLGEFYESAKKAVAPYGDRCRLVRAFSMDAVRDVPMESLGFVYIDGNHEFDFVMEDIIAWSRRVRPGGIVAGHDYYRHKTRPVGVIDAVTAYLKAHAITDAWVFGGQCECEPELPPSWFFIRP